MVYLDLVFRRMVVFMKAIFVYIVVNILLYKENCVHWTLFEKYLTWQKKKAIWFVVFWTLLEENFCWFFSRVGIDNKIFYFT